jgi:hypothetical protein
MLSPFGCASNRCCWHWLPKAQKIESEKEEKITKDYKKRANVCK